MGKRLWGVVLFVVVAALGAEAQYFAVNGACSLGGQATVMQGMASSGTKPLRAGSATFNGSGVMASYPGCTVTVFQTGSNTPALIYSSSIGGSRTNPFTGDLTDGSWVFFASAGCYDVMISSGATQASTMPNSKTFPGLCAGAGSGGGGGNSGTSVLVNGTAAVPNQLNFTNTLLVPGGTSVVNFLLNGNTVGAYVTNSGGGGGTLPTTPQYDLFASTGSGGAQASGLLGGSGFIKGQVFLATGDVTSATAPFPLAPNASVEYFPSGASFGGITIGATNGLAAYFSHSGKSAAGPGYGNGGVMLGGGNSTGTNYQVYVDCESAPLGCDFKVPITVNGSAVGGGGGGLPVIPAPNIFASNGSGAAVDSGVLAQSGFLRGYVLEATGTGTTSPFVVPNASIEYFPTGGYGIGGANGLALHFSHSAVSNGTSPGWGNGGIALGGGNASGVNYQIYLDCESAPLGCDFKVPVTVNGSSIGGGGGITGATANGGLVATGNTLGLQTTCVLSQVLAWNGSAWACATNGAAAPANQTVSFSNALSATLTSTTTALVWACYDNGTPVNAIYPSNVSVSSAFVVTFTFSVPQTGQCVVNSSGGGSGGGGGGGSGTVNSGTAGFYGFYSTTGTAISGNTHLDDGATTAATITAQETLAAPGINVTGSGGIAMTGTGGTLPAPATNSGGIGIGPGNVPQFYSNGGAWTAIGSGGGPTIYTCTIPADTSFGTNICSQALGATARQWRVHCSIPWNFTGGSGTSNVVIGINLSATPSYPTYLTPVMWATTGASNMGAVQVTASGNTPIVTATGLTAGAGGTIFTLNLDGTVAAAANTTIYIYGTASVGTAAFRPGTTCELI